MSKLKDSLLKVGSIGKDADGAITRISYSNEYFEAVNATKALMEEAGLIVSIDRVRNVHGYLPGKSPESKIIAMGSHLDTVKDGGLFDGCAGVMAGIDCVRRFRDLGIQPEHTIEVIGFVGEEAHPLLGGLFGSSAMMGMSNEMDPECLKKGMAMCGVSEEDVAATAVDTSRYECFLELHVEQGDHLISEKKQIGIVQGIVGICRYRICATGQNNHAGTTKMSTRKDALVAMSKMITEINRRAKERGDGFVATVGKLEVIPGAINIVPGYCEAVLEVRSMELGDIHDYVDGIKAYAAQITDASISIETISEKDSVWCDRSIMKQIQAVCEEKGIDPAVMTSGAGHDAKAIAKRLPIAMIFVPSVGGISHNKLEFTEWEDLDLGAGILFETLLKLDKENGR